MYFKFIFLGLYPLTFSVKLHEVYIYKYSYLLIYIIINIKIAMENVISQPL